MPVLQSPSSSVTTTEWQSDDKSKLTPRKPVIHEDGSIIEGQEYGCIDILVKTPEFMRDIFPSMIHSILILIFHITITLMGNTLVALCALSLFELLKNPYWTIIKNNKKKDLYNISKKSEKAFMADWRF